MPTLLAPPTVVHFRGKVLSGELAMEPKTRVNFSMVPKHVGQYVCVVGKNLGVGTGGMTLTIETSDHQKMTVHFAQPLRDPLTPFVELVGKVGSDLSLSAERIVNFGDDFDLETYNELVQLSTQFPHIFTTTTSQF